MAKVALIISLVALVIAVLAYQEAGGSRALQENLRSLQNALDAARKETADALAKMERSLRTTESRESPAAKPPSASKP